MLTCFKGFENNTGFIHKVSVEINIVHGKPENIFVQCNLDLVMLDLVTCDLVTISQRPFFNLLRKIIRFSDITYVI